MRKRTLAGLATALLCATLTVSSCSDSLSPGIGPIDGARAMAHVETIVGFGQRTPGSKSLRQTADYIAAELDKLGLKAEFQEFTHEQADGITFRNVYTQIDGQDPKAGPILAIAAHYDTKVTHGHPTKEHNFPFVGAIDGGGATGLLLELARHLVGRDNEPNIWLIWFDGEESLDFDWNNERSLFGSNHFVDWMLGKDKPFGSPANKRFRCLVLLDLIGDKNLKLDRDRASSKELQDLFAAAAADIGVEARVYPDEFVGEFTDDHIPFRRAGVTAIDLIDFRYRVPEKLGGQTHPDYAAWWHTEEDTIDKMSPAALALVGNLVWAALPRIEKTYYDK